MDEEVNSVKTMTKLDALGLAEVKRSIETPWNKSFPRYYLAQLIGFPIHKQINMKQQLEWYTTYHGLNYPQVLPCSYEGALYHGL